MKIPLTDLEVLQQQLEAMNRRQQVQEGYVGALMKEHGMAVGPEFKKRNNKMVDEIKTGDVVYVPSVDEEWIVAFSENGFLCCCGWPCTLVKVAECKLVERATPDERRQLLKQLAEISPEGGYPDPRALYAKRVLADYPREPADSPDRVKNG